MIYFYLGKALIGLFSAVLILGMLRGDRSLGDYYALKHKQKILQKTVTHLETEIHELQEEIRRIENSEEYAQKVLRDKYHLLSEGEQMILFD